jgi:antitoxin ChpS
VHTTHLRKVGGSVMLTLPPAVLDALELSVGAKVGLAVDNGRLVIEPQRRRPRYTVEELLAASDYSQPRTAEEQEWLSSPPIGRELL